MTYARSRLWLGITGVGSLVVITGLALVFGLPDAWFAQDDATIGVELTQLCLLTAFVAAWLMPLDFLGGYWLPRAYERSKVSFSSWLVQYLATVLLQAMLFVGFGCGILLASQSFGMLGGVLTVLTAIGLCVCLRNWLVSGRRAESAESTSKLVDALSLVQSWNVYVPKTMIVDHGDPGFTGGIIGWGKRLKIVVPSSWLRFSTEQLATCIGRRALAVQTGSYQRGIIAAVLWNLAGFLGCTWLTGSDLATVSGLVTTVCWFTLWTFVGLLTLPTLSRNASLKIDQQLRERGASSDWILSTTFAMDQLQDGEPERRPLIEAIFHPIPSVASRNATESGSGFGAWNVARTTLFFSWACLGFLSRAVHCNVGRPELWTMLPSD